jgi:hypothetical protein
MLLLPLLLQAFTGCASPEKIRNESVATGNCVVHNVKLQEKMLYRFKGCMLFDTYVYKAYERFPNAIRPEYTEKPFSGGHSEPTKVIYCEVCDKQATELCEKISKGLWQRGN